MKFNTVVLAVVILGLTTAVHGEQIFQSTFDGGSGLLTGHVAESGQTWADSPKAEVNDSRGKGSLALGIAFGQSSEGAGAQQEGNYWQGNSVALGQGITDGIMTLSFDLKRHRTSGHNASAELNVALMGNYETALVWQGGSLKVGGSVVGLNGGAWQKSLDMGISTGDVHVELLLDMATQANRRKLHRLSGEVSKFNRLKLA
ncbi:MAG: hypothetical protein U9N87_05375 [Planctomycetota bacterium]|nr:hypothetical protein [Planctomycetota bacterium]